MISSLPRIEILVGPPLALAAAIFLNYELQLTVVGRLNCSSDWYFMNWRSGSVSGRERDVGGGEKDAAYDSCGELGATVSQCLNTKIIMDGPFTAPYHPINLA